MVEKICENGQHDICGLCFQRELFSSRIVLPNGEVQCRPFEIRFHPITGRSCRITFSRSEEKEPGTSVLPMPPPFAGDNTHCPFCRENIAANTPRLDPDLCPEGRLIRGRSTLFPNLYPYGRYSAVSLFDENHFVEIAAASHRSYTDCFLNCRDYLKRVLSHDPAAVYMAITQNHLPSAGGSLLHPHLQVQADRISSNHQRYLKQRATEYLRRFGTRIFSDYLKHEQRSKSRFVGKTGPWQWLCAFAPEGFYEIWGILPEATDFRKLEDDDWKTLVQGILNAQRFYRSLDRNGYNLGLLLFADGSTELELRVVLTVRGNYAPWVRSDLTGFEVMLGDMATFTAPEQTAKAARPFWQSGPPSSITT